MLPIIQLYLIPGIELSWFQLQDSLPNCCDCRGRQPAVFSCSCETMTNRGKINSWVKLRAMPRLRLSPQPTCQFAQVPSALRLPCQLSWMLMCWGIATWRLRWAMVQ